MSEKQAGAKLHKLIGTLGDILVAVDAVPWRDQATRLQWMRDNVRAALQDVGPPYYTEGAQTITYTQPEPVGPICPHGRPAGEMCPHCMGAG